MNVLVINCGSSSLKYQLIDSESEAVLAKGLCERIGIDGRLVYQKTGLDKEITEAAMPTHKQAIQMVLELLVNPKTGAIASLSRSTLSTSCRTRWREVRSIYTSDTGSIKDNRGVQRSCTASQPGKPDRYRCLQGTDAERADGWRIRYRFPSDNAEESISLRSAS